LHPFFDLFSEWFQNLLNDSVGPPVPPVFNTTSTLRALENKSYN
jgi:hypothetical protein